MSKSHTVLEYDSEDFLSNPHTYSLAGILDVPVEALAKLESSRITVMFEQLQDLEFKTRRVAAFRDELGVASSFSEICIGAPLSSVSSITAELVKSKPLSIKRMLEVNLPFSPAKESKQAVSSNEYSDQFSLFMEGKAVDSMPDKHFKKARLDNSRASFSNLFVAGGEAPKLSLEPIKQATKLKKRATLFTPLSLSNGRIYKATVNQKYYSSHVNLPLKKIQDIIKLENQHLSDLVAKNAKRDTIGFHKRRLSVLNDILNDKSKANTEESSGYAAIVSTAQSPRR